MAYNFGGNSNPRFPSSSGPNQHFPGMASFQQQGIQQQQQQQQHPHFQHGMQQGYPPRQGFQSGLAQFPGNMTPVQPQIQQVYNPQQQQYRFPGNMTPVQPQIQQAYNPQQQQKYQQQYKKMMEQQQKVAQESQKMQNELRKKRDFELQQKKLQQFGQGGGVKRTGGGDLAHLIGSLAQRNTDKPTSKHQVQSSSGRSFFARPGASYPPPPTESQHAEHHVQEVQQLVGQHQPYTPQQQPINNQQQPYTPQQQPINNQHQSYIPQQQPINNQQQPYTPQPQPNMSQQQPTNQPQYPNIGGTFGSGTGGNSFGQVNEDDDFSDFQEAKPGLPVVGSNLAPTITSNNQGAQWSNQTTENQPGHLLSMPGQSASKTSNMGWTNPSPSWNTHGSVSSMVVSSASMQSSGFGAHSASAVPSVGMPTSSQRERTDSQSSMSSTSSSGLQIVQGIGTNVLQQEGHSSMSTNMPVLAQASQGITPMAPLSGRQRQGSFTSQSMLQPGMTNMQHGMQINVPSSRVGSNVMPSMTHQQFDNEQNSPGQVGESGDCSENIEEESEDSKLEKLYGIAIPDWCNKGDNLPGIYKDVKEAATVNGSIDTGTLYPILLASDLPRDILGQIWSRVNKASPGQLNDMELRMMLGLVALGQTGIKVEKLTLEKLATCRAAPIPSIPENVLKGTEGNWSFQKEPQVSQADSTSLSLQNNYQIQANSDPTSQSYDKYSGIKVSNETIAKTTSCYSSLDPNTNSLISQPTLKHGGLMPDRNKDHAILSSSPEFQGFQSAMPNMDAPADFGDFQCSDSTSTSTSTSNSNVDNVSDFKSTPAINLAISLESLELKSVEAASSNEKVNSLEKPLQSSSSGEFGEFAIFSSTVTSSKSTTSESHVVRGSKNSDFGGFPVIKMPPTADSAASVDKTTNNLSIVNVEKKDEKRLQVSPSATPQHGNAKPIDKYDFLRDLGNDDTTIFSAPQTSQNKDDSFGDFEGFDQAGTSTENEFGEFGDFQSTVLPTSDADIPSSVTKMSDNWGLSTLDSANSQSSYNEPDFTKTQAPAALSDDFGDFSDFESVQSNPVSSASNVVEGLMSLSSSSFDASVSSTQLSGPVSSSFNGSFDSQKKSSNSGSNSLTNTVPLDSAQRYKQLCGEEEDAEKHASVWGRCLNSCLLTLATCAVAVQTMSDPNIKQEVLQSKKGIEYFTAVIEVFKVTRRVQVSLMKTDFVNEKLKDVLEEINQTWKNIANFLTGTNIEANVTKENFSSDHVQGDEDRMLACGLCLLNVKKTTDSKLAYGGREYHSTCANFWCNRVDSILPSLWPVNSLI